MQGQQQEAVLAPNRWAQPSSAAYGFLTGRDIEAVRRFHGTIKGYEPTPLVELKALAGHLGIEALWVKDESRRFDIESFKVLGGSYAVCRLLCERFKLDPTNMDFEDLKERIQAEKRFSLTLCTASDGNHGRGIAWTARQLGLSAHVFLPKGTALERVEAIERLGARAKVTDLNYDDTVRLAEKTADEKGWHLVQDTAWPGYETIPKWIMQGYATMAAEAVEQIEKTGGGPPTHVFLQAGVGAMAAGVLGYLLGRYGEGRFKTVIVEPERAACYYKSALINDGTPHAVGGDLATMMAGLSCGEPVTVGYGIIRDHAHAFASCKDSVAALGMRMLSSPLPGDERVISGESGAVGLGLAALLCGEADQSANRALAGIGKDARILVFNTEGATDRANFMKVVWGKDIQT